MGPEISVIMSVYNDDKYLSRSIESILSQTFTNFEFIICNDCSTDDSKEVIDYYANKDYRIKVISNRKNCGLASSLNKCIDISKGKYIARMDSDDISLPNRLMEEHRYLEANPSFDVVGCKCEVIDEKDNIYKEFLIKKGEVFLEDAVKKVQVIHPTTLIKSISLRAVNGYTSNDLTTRAEDYDLWCKLLSSGSRIYNLSDVLFLYREGKQGMKKRKFAFRIQEAKLKYHWMKKIGTKKNLYIWAIKPIVIGLIPSKLMLFYKRYK